jgi:hypothetical protein
MTKASLGILLALLASLTVVGIGVSAQPYTSVATLFDIGVGARPAGLGNAFVGLADDETAAFYNPSGLAFWDRFALNSYSSWQFSALLAFSVCLGAPHFGATFLQLDSGVIEAIDEMGNPIGSFHYVSRGGILSAGFAFLDYFAVGAKVKLFQSSSHASLLGFGGSFSPALLFQWAGFRLGVTLENLFATPVYFNNGHMEGWPCDVRIGGSLRLGSFSGSLEVENLLALRGASGLPHTHVGLEAKFTPVVFRMGFDQGMLSLGMSIDWNRVRLDYATAIHFQMPMSHRLALAVYF